MSRAPVVDLNGKPPQKRRAAAPRGAHDLITELQLKARSRLEVLLVTLFNNTDDALFERADRSHSNADQQMYFESMRQLRLQRAEVLKGFHRAVREAFALLEQPEDPAVTEDLEPDFDDISLVQQEDLEISVAISGIVSKVTSQHSLPIMQLTKRLDHLTPARKVTEKTNPLGPQVLGESFAKGLDCVEIDITIRIILFKLFERFVMEQLTELYTESNAFLAEAGVLPDLKHPYRDARRAKRQPRAPESAAPTADGDPQHPEALSASGAPLSAGTGYAAVGAEFGVIQRLLAQSQGRGSISVPPPSGMPLISTNQLIEALSQLQTTSDVPALDQADVPGAMDLSAVLAGQAKALTGRDAAGLHQADDDVVNFVGMLFDYILNDRNLAIPMKALIARLQIPIVKLAIMDKGFFEQANHPARRLLNELSSAGIGWSSANELKRDALYNTIESIVARVLNEFHSNPGIFEVLTDELRRFVSRDQRRSEIVEQRLKETEQGKARTQDAKRSAQNVINQKAAGLRLHPRIGRFISDTWSKVLVFVCVKHGSESEEWSEAVANLDALLWSIQPLNSLDDVQRRDNDREPLLSRLQSGMRVINIPEEEMLDTLTEVRKHLVEISEHDRAFLEDDTPPPPPPAEERQVVEAVQLAEAGEEESVDVLPKAEHMRMVDKLTEGNWVELKADSGEQLRCKLATIIGSGKRYIFVNRRGMKVAEQSRIQLADGVGKGTVTLLDEAEVFDKALEAVIGNLRHLRSQPARID